MIDKEALLAKIAAMFRPRDGNFLDYKARDVICGPNDRAMFGADTNFPKEWLVEDFDFTAEEADFFVSMVRAADR